jgi:hypothetical protein
LTVTVLAVALGLAAVLVLTAGAAAAGLAVWLAEPQADTESGDGESCDEDDGPVHDSFFW